MTAAARILEIFDTEPDIVSGTTVVERPRGHLRFEHVDFAFPDAPDEPVLRDVNLDVAPGETVALVGATGSGKTTLTGLVPRLYDVTGGRVTIDGVDVRDLTLAHLRSLVATAFEEPTLFSMSVRENLTLGRADADEDEIRSALEVGQAGFVHDLPWGLDTRIGEQGMSLSGGQRQRLALARAVLAGPRVLVLDDTLSALDVHTERLVEEALRRVLADTTGLVVAHRASTVLLADRVALLQDGTITHVGDHRELLDTVPAYRELLSAEMGAPTRRPRWATPTRHRPRRRGRPSSGAASPPTTSPTSSPTRPRPGLADRSRRLLGDLLAPYRRAIQLLVAIVVVENAARLSIPLPRQGGHRHRHPADPGRPATPARCSSSWALVLVATIIPGRRAQPVPGPLRADRPGHPLRDPSPGVPPLPGPEPVLPRPLHLRAGDLPADLRRRRDLRDARDRVRRPGHRGADPGRHRRAAARSST